MHYPHGQPFGGYYHYRRGPSRFWWFLLGAGAVMAWNYAHKSETERRRFGWRWDRCVKDDASRGRREDGFTAPVRNAEQEYASSLDEARREDGQGYEPMWRLRSEKEAERQKAIRDMEVREQLLNAREKVLHATESGLETLRQSLDSLTKMVQEQRRDNPRDRSPEKKRLKDELSLNRLALVINMCFRILFFLRSNVIQV